MHKHDGACDFCGANVGLLFNDALDRIAQLERERDELAERNKNLCLTLDLYRGPHVTMTVSYAEELETAKAERDEDRAAIRALSNALDELDANEHVPGWLQLAIQQLLEQHATAIARATGARHE